MLLEDIELGIIWYFDMDIFVKIFWNKYDCMFNLSILEENLWSL